MSDAAFSTLGEIQRSLIRIETKIDGSLTWMAQHAVEDKATAQVVAKLARQKGFVLTGFAAVGAGIAAGAAYLVKRMIGH